MQNYQLQLDDLIKSLIDKPKLLLHSCCAPCSSYVLNYLKDHFDITVYYYNPNIYPVEEYLKRKEEQKRLLNILGIPLIDDDYEPEVFNNYITGFESDREGGNRCSKCFRLRLTKTFDKALAEGFNYFGTTLTVSPHKNSGVINEIGLSISQVKYLASDFKKKEGYKKSLEYSKEYQLYRQDYCGCQYSMHKKD